MNRETFLAQLKAALDDMPEADRKDVLGYFEELILDKAADLGVPEENVIAQLGDISDIAQSVRTSAAGEGVPAQGRREPVGDNGIGELVFTVDAGQVRSLVLRVNNSRVTVRVGQENQVVIHYTQSQHNRYLAAVNNSELIFEQVQPAGFLAWGISALLEPTRPIEVFLPREFAGKADLATSNGQIRWEGVSAWGSLILKTSNGALEIDGIAAKDITANTSNGRGTIRQVKAQGPVMLHTGNGRVEAFDVQAAMISLRSSNGALQISNIKADDITLRTSNGSIEGVIAGNAREYSVTSGTSNGKNSLAGHAHTGPKRLSAHTSNASIRIQFKQDEAV